MKKAIVYARAKADLSDFGLTSVKEQFLSCKEYAEKHGLEISGLFTDIIPFGTKPEFVVWKAILNNKRPNFDYIIVSDNARIGRDISQCLKDRTKLKERGITIRSATGDISCEQELFYILTKLKEAK